MRRTLLLALLLAVALPARAQFARVFASARSGNDLNTCNDINTPCQSLQGAVNQVSAGGTVIVLDTGGYGPATIGKALTVDVPNGVIAFIHPPSGSGITINAGSTDTVVLRGLSLNTNTGTFAGIDVVTGGSVRVENCTIQGFGSGIRQQGPGLLVVRDSTIRVCSTGITSGNLTGTGTVVVERCRLKGNQYGLSAGPLAKVEIRGCNISGNVQVGLSLDSHQSGLYGEIVAEDCLVAHNGTGVLSLVYDGGLGLVRISDSTVVDNNTGLWADGGSILSRTNNTVEGNTADTTGTITPYSAK